MCEVWIYVDDITAVLLHEFERENGTIATKTYRKERHYELVPYTGDYLKSSTMAIYYFKSPIFNVWEYGNLTNVI